VADEGRCIERAERSERGWVAAMEAWYGSRDAAVEAARASQRRRWDVLAISSLPFLHLDTREQDWSRYADAIAEFWSS
jgi:hypothetical protein